MNDETVIKVIIINRSLTKGTQKQRYESVFEYLFYCTRTYGTRTQDSFRTRMLFIIYCTSIHNYTSSPRILLILYVGVVVFIIFFCSLFCVMDTERLCLTKIQINLDYIQINKYVLLNKIMFTSNKNTPRITITAILQFTCICNSLFIIHTYSICKGVSGDRLRGTKGTSPQTRKICNGLGQPTPQPAIRIDSKIIQIFVKFFQIFIKIFLKTFKSF